MSGRDRVPPNPRAWALSAALKEVRLANGYKVIDVARSLRTSHTTISQYENGHRLPSIETVASILTAVHASADDRERVLDIARNVHDPHWLTVGIGGISSQLSGAIECERSAFRITEWSPMTVPGLIQTPDYALAVKAGDEFRSKDDVSSMINAGRRDIVKRLNDPVLMLAFIGETALYEPVGSRAIATDQFRHLIQLTQQSNVTIRIVPIGLGWHPGFSGPFVLYEFRDTKPVIHFEHHSSGAFVPDEHDVTEYRKVIDWLDRIALSCDDSVARLSKASEEMEMNT